MVSRYFMSALRRRRSALRATFTLPTTQLRATDKSGALALLEGAQRYIAPHGMARWAGPSRSLVPPAQVLDDPVRVADRVAADHEQRDAVLAGEGGDLLAVGLARRHPPFLDLDAVAPQLAR